MRKSVIYWIVIFLPFMLSSLCYGQSSKEALNALKKLGTVVQTGVSYQDYSRVLADAKHPVSLFLETPEAKLNKGLASAFEKAIDHHDVALGLWRIKFAGRKVTDFFMEDSRVFQSVLDAYPDAPTKYAAYSKERYIVISEVLSFIWGKASAEIATATLLVGQAAEVQAAAIKDTDAVKKENDALRNEVLTIKIKLEMVQKENAELKMQIEAFQKGHSDLTAQIETLRKENFDLTAQMSQSRKPTTRRK